MSAPPAHPHGPVERPLVRNGEPWPFAIRVQNSSVAVRGDLDLATAATLEMIADPVSNGPAGVVVLDLGGVEFIDAAGLRAIVHLADAAQQQERSLVLANPRPQALKLFALLEPHEALPFTVVG